LDSSCLNFLAWESNQFFASGFLTGCNLLHFPLLNQAGEIDICQKLMDLIA
jgi:hypothetical protein